MGLGLGRSHDRAATAPSHPANTSRLEVAPTARPAGRHASSRGIASVGDSVVRLGPTACTGVQVEEQDVVSNVSVCLFVCLSVLAHISPITRPKFVINLSVHVAWLGYRLVAYVAYFRFCGCHHFSHIGSVIKSLSLHAAYEITTRTCRNGVKQVFKLITGDSAVQSRINIDWPRDAKYTHQRYAYVTCTLKSKLLP